MARERQAPAGNLIRVGHELSPAGRRLVVWSILGLAFVVVFARAHDAQARVSSAPPEPSLLNITRQWSRASSLGDLRELRGGSDFRELRAWSGYALTGGTQAVVLRRSDGHWSAYLARVLRCEMEIPRAIWDTASRVTMQRFIGEARRHCGVPLTDVTAGSRVLTTDSLVVEPLSASEASIEDAWTAAERAGALQLPARVARDRPMDDGFTYVVEMRSGDVYRASAIEQVEPPESRADEQVKAVYAAVNRLLRPEQLLKPHL